MSNIGDIDLVKKTKKSMFIFTLPPFLVVHISCTYIYILNLAAEKITENIFMIGNEPCLACYRINEHIHKNGPLINKERVSYQIT
jgi:hypothetical protein